MKSFDELAAKTRLFLDCIEELESSIFRRMNSIKSIKPRMTRTELVELVKIYCKLNITQLIDRDGIIEILCRMGLSYKVVPHNCTSSVKELEAMLAELDSDLSRDRLLGLAKNQCHMSVQLLNDRKHVSSILPKAENPIEKLFQDAESMLDSIVKSESTT